MSTASTPDTRRTAPPGRRRGWKALEIALFVAGAACLIYVGAVRLTGYFGSKREIARFERRVAETNARPAPAPAPPVAEPVAPAEPSAPAAPVEAEAPPTLPIPSTSDFRLWSPERIRGYKESLAEADTGALALLRIPNLEIEAAVLPGTSDWALNRGLGWIEGTAKPGEPGNVGIAGHRDGFFRGLKDIAAGDSIELTVPGGVQHYRVASITIVKPEDVSVLDPTAQPSLTLVSCYPFYFVGSAPERFIVKATRTEP